MPDLEQRLTDALTAGAQGAPSAVGLAGAARDRARQKRRTRIAGGAALVVLAVGVPGAMAAVGGDGGRGGDGPADRGNTVTDPNDPDQGTPEGYRYESWRSVTVRVPDTWGYGNPDSWCAGDGAATDPVVGRPGVTNSIACSPFSSYGLMFSPARGHDVQWPVYPQHSDSWPDGAYVGATTVGDVVITVATPEPTLSQGILDSARAIGPEGDPNGCAATRDATALAVPEGGMAVCRYDEAGVLEQSEVLEGTDMGAAFAALESAPVFVGDCIAADQGHQVVQLRNAQFQADVHLDGSCPRIIGLDGDRSVTADVLYWALSPGWTGAVGESIPLPQELRTE